MSSTVETPEKILKEIRRFIKSCKEMLSAEMHDPKTLLYDLIDAFLYMYRLTIRDEESFASNCLNNYLPANTIRQYAIDKKHKRTKPIDPTYHQEVKDYFEPVIQLLENKEVEIDAEA